MSIWYLAFFTGFFGSVHCLGMCGPLAFAVTSRHSGWWMVLFDKLSYQFGRIISYSLLGALIGLVGQQLWMSGLQQFISVASGVLILTAGASRIFRLRASVGSAKGIGIFSRAFTYALKHKANHLITGMLNGLLPCGFVYLALAGAVTVGNTFGAVKYMILFGLGTLPLMLVATFGLGLVGPAFRRRINQAVPYLMVCLGVWFILRGASLDVPFLSPRVAPQTEVCN
ncbi:sulfite exporter TauE/SafE family protein [Arcticibacter sp.]|uniref:sulfite exporter TauE/SafE family protein n=1 Tax=Arcticibacter sp. TaxID=1872630 RepID=UPI00388DB149